MHTNMPNMVIHRGLAAPRGFSLIELVLVMTIISILAAIAVPRYAEALARYRADAAAKRVVIDLAYAREHARSASANVEVRVQTATNTLTIIGADHIDHSGKDYETDLSSGPYHASIRAVNFGGDGVVRFNGYGEPDSGGTVTLYVGTEQRGVVLDAQTGKAVAQ